MKLSVIVPVLNEIDQLPQFIDMLSRQQGVELDLILVDGGSNDGTAELIAKLEGSCRWPVAGVQAEKGRARQLNAGADRSASELLLFLHADSVFRDERALAKALSEYHASVEARGGRKLAGHFRLKFSRSSDEPIFGYYFWEAKARLDRPECTHGDQGFLIARTFFQEVGPFDTDIPIAEDTRLADRIRRHGEWILFNSEIWTSARRFEVEGLRERQTLNALIMNFAAIGWTEFFLEAKMIYQVQSESEKLNLLPFFDLIDRLNRETPWRKRLLRWYETGTYVRPNAWQLAFLKDVRRNFSQSVPVDDVSLANLARHHRWFEMLTNNLFGRLIAMCGTWLWYRLTVRRYRQMADADQPHSLV